MSATVMPGFSSPGSGARSREFSGAAKHGRTDDRRRAAGAKFGTWFASGGGSLIIMADRLRMPGSILKSIEKRLDYFTVRADFAGCSSRYCDATVNTIWSKLPNLDR